MKLERFDIRNVIGGLLTVLLGAATLLKSRSYPMGTALRVGPGFFPAILAVLITALGVLMLVASLRPQPAAEPLEFRWRPVLMISSGIALFAVLLERAGLAAATVALVFVSSLSEPAFRPIRSVVLSASIFVMIYVVFILVLRMPISVLP